ncbi:hypothetical protein BXZ70DRAFT_316248 [Cristinia sonorae]|uniref:Uncharacterized protein n=1 Tax=Cristinia sonorae TaxID=1940300 RepID=A0A8K0UL79_9AGAR|nr:hypothetical protein BXZ70DRAFT_316248 [Cristinia sonorae]
MAAHANAYPSEPSYNRPLTPSGTSRASPTDLVFRQDALGIDHGRPDTVYQTPTVSHSISGIHRNPHSSLPIHAPIPRAPVGRVGIDIDKGGSPLGLSQSTDTTASLLQRIAQTQEKPQANPSTTASPPQARVPSRLRRNNVPRELSLKSRSFANSRYHPADTPEYLATRGSDAGNMAEEPPTSNRVASPTPLLLPGVGVPTGHIFAQEQQPIHPATSERSPSPVLGYPTPPNLSTNPYGPPPVYMTTRDLPSLTPDLRGGNTWIQNSRLSAATELSDERHQQPVAGPSVEGETHHSQGYPQGTNPSLILRAPSGQTLLSPIQLRPQELEPHHLLEDLNSCRYGMNRILFSMGTMERYSADVAAVCQNLRSILVRITGSLESGPSSVLREELAGEEYGKRWLTNYTRVLESLLKCLQYFSLFQEQLGSHPPYAHRVDRHMNKLWEYLTKLADLYERLEHYHERLPIVQLMLRQTAMRRAAREELGNERQRRRDWENQWADERRQRKDLRDEIRRMRGTLRPVRR